MPTIGATKDIAIMLAAVALVAAGWFIRGWYEDSQELVIQKAAHAAQLATAEEIKNIEIKHTTIQGKVVEHTYHDPVYMDCRHDKEAWDLLMEKFK